MSTFPGAGQTIPMSAPKPLRKRPSETAKIPGAAKSISITDKSTEARPSSAPKPTRTRP